MGRRNCYISLGFGGETGPTDVLANTESWNGTNWTEVNDLNTARRLLSGTGTDNTNCLASGGYDGTAYTAKTESWNGTNWTNENQLNTAKGLMAMSGNSTSGLSMGGWDNSTVLAETEEWYGDGTLSENID